MPPPRIWYSLNSPRRTLDGQRRTTVRKPSCPLPLIIIPDRPGTSSVFLTSCDKVTPRPNTGLGSPYVVVQCARRQGDPPYTFILHLGVGITTVSSWEQSWATPESVDLILSTASSNLNRRTSCLVPFRRFTTYIFLYCPDSVHISPAMSKCGEMGSLF